ncbi:MAG: class I SAM-dependent methyltransferase [Nitrospirota bacterium]
MDPRLKAIVGSGKCVVDLGCGCGQLLISLADRFEHRIGLDISSRRLEESADGRIDGWEFRKADLNAEFPLEDGSMDAVVANQVIEHITDSVRFAQEIHRVLRSGGRCVITTPNIRYLKNVAHVLFSGYGPRTAGGNTVDGGWDDGHLHYFTHRDLRELFFHLGFRAVESAAFIDLAGAGWLRRKMDRHAAAWPIREFLSGNILLWAEK